MTLVNFDKYCYKVDHSVYGEHYNESYYSVSPEGIPLQSLIIIVDDSDFIIKPYKFIFDLEVE